MPIFYHGTSVVHATSLTGSLAAGGIDVTVGGGEFGRGFYSQTSSSNAQRRGFATYGAQAAVLRLTIDDLLYHALKIKTLSLDQARMLDRKLTGGARTTYVTAHDAIVGPLVNQPRIEQQKFQSASAQTLLNGLNTARSIV